MKRKAKVRLVAREWWVLVDGREEGRVCRTPGRSGSFLAMKGPFYRSTHPTRAAAVRALVRAAKESK